MSRESSENRLKKLEQIERDLTTALSSAGSALTELAKDKPNARQVETNSTAFLKGISKVEHDLSEQIQYLTQVSSGQAHGGSSYAAQKVVAMAWHRLEHTKTRLGELERMTASQVSHVPPQQQGPSGPPPIDQQQQQIVHQQPPQQHPHPPLPPPHMQQQQMPQWYHHQQNHH